MAPRGTARPRLTDNTNEQDEPADTGLSDHLGALASASRTWITDSIGLILLDGQLAGVSLVRMLIYGLVAFVMFVTAWLGLMLAAAFLLHRLGLPIELVILSVVSLTTALGVFLVFRITALSANMTFQTTRSHLGKGGDNDHDVKATNTERSDRTTGSATATSELST